MARRLVPSSLARLAWSLALAAALTGPPLGALQPAFFPDDPLAVDPETEDASSVQPWVISDSYDRLAHALLRRGDRSNRRAMNVNTIDEVPDSSWFTNRGSPGGLDAAAVARGPGTGDGPAPGPWTVVSHERDGNSLGITVRDAAGVTWFITFDPPAHPEMATGAEIVASRLFWALGYHVPETHLATLRPDALTIADGARGRPPAGGARPIARADIEGLLARAARRADGTYRVVASRALPGSPLGPFRYDGTRPDDPNDIVPHEHRRELRALRAFAAWLDHRELHSRNTLDTLVERGGRRIVWHHLVNFSAALGSGRAQAPRAGDEPLAEARPAALAILTLGWWGRPWIRARYPDIPAVGRIEAAFFRPETWKPQYPNPALQNARADDLFWAARRAMAITDEAIAAVVRSAAFSDPAATRYLTDVIVARRDKVGLAWLPALNPLVDFALDRDGRLAFRHAAADARLAPPARTYRLRWARVDNLTRAVTPVGPVVDVEAPPARAPAGVLDAPFVQVEAAAIHEQYPAWARPVRVVFRRIGSGWKLVGLERMPD